MTSDRITEEAQTFFNEGYEHLQRGEHKEAIQSFSEAIRRRPDVAVGYRFRAYAHAESGNTTQAITDLDHALRLNPDDIQAYIDRATELFHQRQFEASLHDCNAVLTRDPLRAAVYGLRGRVYAAFGNSPAAEADFEKAIELDPKDAATYLLWRAEARSERGAAQDAIEDFTAVLKSKPDLPPAFHGRGLARHALGDFSGAVADFSEAIRLRPDVPWPFTGRGMVRFAQGDFRAADEDFSASLRMHPTYLQALEYRGQARANLGRFPEAIADLNEALRLAPKSVRLWNRLGTVNYSARDYAKAIRAHMEALKIDPRESKTFNYLSWLWATVPNPTLRHGPRAVECATRACELAEWLEPSYLDTLAAAYAEVGEYAKAVYWGERAIEICRANGVSEDRLKEYQHRLASYQRNQPVRVIPPAPGELNAIIDI